MEILPFYIKNVGPYAYRKLANVQSKTIFGGLENANTIFYSEGSVGGKRKSEALIAHEIAHQWFGNMATEKTFAHLWLSEGFATYMTILYLENKYGKDTAVSMLQQDRREVIAFAKTSNRPVVDTTHNYMELLNANSYQKGGWVLHMLRKELGDSLFWKSIRKYYATYAGKIAGTDDLRRVIESVSGRNFELFFSQWLHTPGIPQVHASWQYDTRNKEITFTVRQLQTTAFTIPLEIEWILPGGTPTRKTLLLDGREKSVTYKVAAKPVRVNLDPDTALLFEGNLEER
jgi:aminopeptidase N